MGVSPTDVATYVNNLGGYIYTILGAFVLAVVVIVAAQFVVKKAGVIWWAGPPLARRDHNPVRYVGYGAAGSQPGHV